MGATLHAQKRDTMLELLDRGLVMVHLDPRAEGVVVPSHLASDPTLRLNIAYGFNLPALEIDLEGIYAVLSFGGVNHGCTVPWVAVFALTMPDDKHAGRLWPSSLPAELAEAAEALVEASGEAPAPEAPSLTLVDGGEVAEASPEEPVEEVPPAERPTLRLVTD